MARKCNIMNYLLQQIDRGNALFDQNGNFVSVDYLENADQRAYIEALKEGYIDVSVTFEDFCKSHDREVMETIPVMQVYDLLNKTYSFSYLYSGHGKDLLRHATNKADSQRNGSKRENRKGVDK